MSELDNLPFVGLKVLDISQGVAGPHCGMLLARHGADVVKVDAVQLVVLSQLSHSPLQELVHGRARRAQEPVVVDVGGLLPRGLPSAVDVVPLGVFVVNAVDVAGHGVHPGVHFHSRRPCQRQELFQPAFGYGQVLAAVVSGVVVEDLGEDGVDAGLPPPAQATLPHVVGGSSPLARRDPHPVLLSVFHSLTRPYRWKAPGSHSQEAGAEHLQKLSLMHESNRNKSF